MASLNSEIILKEHTWPCYVGAEKAIFHKWGDSFLTVIQPDHTEYKALTLGICEFEDGTIREVYPHEIRFADGGEFRETIWR